MNRIKRIAAVLMTAFLIAGIWAPVPAEAATVSVAEARIQAWKDTDRTSCYIVTKKQGIAEFQYQIFDNSMEKIATEKSQVYSNISNDKYDVCLVEGLPEWSCSFVRVRARKSTGPWSEWSPKICVVPLHSKSAVTQTGDGKLKVNLSWKEVTGATDYLVYMSTTGTGDWKRIASVSTGEPCTLSLDSFDGNKFERKTKYYWKVITRRKYEGEYVTSRGNAADIRANGFYFY